MTVTLQRFSFQDYLSYDDGTDQRYELVEGELIPMSLGTGEHGGAAECIYVAFNAEAKRLGLNWTAKLMMVGIQSPQRGRWDTSRIPDVVVLPTEQWQELARREAVIRLNEPPPLLVVEVVSESTLRTDYRTKRAEYNVLGIEEYWIVDPLAQRVTICLLVDDLYEATEFGGDDLIRSRCFPELNLTVADIFAA